MVQVDTRAEPIASGQRLQILRTRRGMSRPTPAGLVGRSPFWVKAVEAGRPATPKLPRLLTIAEALRVHTLAALEHLEQAESASPRRRGRAGELADKIGILTA